ncbi:hypothetical protein BHM03_00025564 [Ensete ventricosum]|nr:hypothetical protein BHM03_00025564 [Ensete ventricosum]
MGRGRLGSREHLLVIEAEVVGPIRDEVAQREEDSGDVLFATGSTDLEEGDEGYDGAGTVDGKAEVVELHEAEEGTYGIFTSQGSAKPEGAHEVANGASRDDGGFALVVVEKVEELISLKRDRYSDTIIK